MREKRIATSLFALIGILSAGYALWYRAYSSSYVARFDSASAFVYVFYAVPTLRFLAGVAVGTAVSRRLPVLRANAKGALILLALALLPLTLRILPVEQGVLMYELLGNHVLTWLPSAVGVVLGMSGKKEEAQEG